MAIVSTCALATPPEAYGGTELVLADLAGALSSLGHRPTVFATGDSTCVGAKKALFETSVWPPDELAELRHAAAAFELIDADGPFDVVHVNHAGALPFAGGTCLPTVATVHHERVPNMVRHYVAYPGVAFAAISQRQAELSSEIPFRAVIHHGLDVRRYPEGTGGEYAAFLGRFAPEKAPHLAIEVAERTKVPLRLGGKAHPCEAEYFERVVAPRLGGSIEWLGELDQARKVKLLGGARALLFPIQWEEPFGLVMIESMLVGTPVIAFPSGAAPEIVEEGVTGFLVSNVAEMCERLGAIDRIDRRRCRAVAQRTWSAMRMAEKYAALYRELALGPRRTRTRGAFEEGEHHGQSPQRTG